MDFNRLVYAFLRDYKKIIHSGKSFQRVAVIQTPREYDESLIKGKVDLYLDYEKDLLNRDLPSWITPNNQDNPTLIGIEGLLGAYQQKIGTEEGMVASNTILEVLRFSKIKKGNVGIVIFDKSPISYLISRKIYPPEEYIQIPKIPKNIL